MPNHDHDDLIWRPHDNEWLTALCEQFTQAGQTRTASVSDALFTAIGSRQKPLLTKSAQWSDQQIALVKARLQKPLAQYTPEDWLALIDLIIQTQLSADDLQAQADWLAYRAQLAGRLSALAEQRPTIAPKSALLGLITSPRFPTLPPVTATLKVAWQWAKTRIGAHLTQVTDGLRARIANTVICHIQEHGLAARGKLEQSLLDDVGDLNRDWRRIAITEAGEVANQTYLGEFQHETRMKRLEAYQGACQFCAALNGRVFIWSEVPLDERFGQTHIWPGKTNVGRSSSPNKRTPNGLVPRTESELWWPAAGVQHPHCRGRWLALLDLNEDGTDPEFARWVQETLRSG